MLKFGGLGAVPTVKASINQAEASKGVNVKVMEWTAKEVRAEMKLCCL